MKKIALTATALGIAAGAAQAGSIQRDTDKSQILFEEGRNYLEFSVVSFTGNISGEGTGQFAGLQSGNIFRNYQTYSLGYKRELNEKLTFAIVANNPVGADVAYSATSAPYPFATAEAEIDAVALTAYLKYQFTENVSAYGGLRLQSLSGNVDLPSPLPGVIPRYQLDVDEDYKFGYVLGAAYEIPDIAMRVALTYESKIEHDFRDNNGVPFDVEIPQAVTFHGRTGIAPTVLLFGSVRWQEWSKFQVAPQDFLDFPANTSGLPIAFGADDFWTYEVGLGKSLNENWSIAGTLGYETDANKPVGNLEGKDGYVSYGASVRYSTEAYDVAVGLKYFDLGSAETTTIGSQFSGNDVLALGVRLGWRF